MGRQAWQILKAVQPAVQTFVDKVAGAGGAQPVAWTGRTDLLLRVYRALLLAHTGAGNDVESFLSLRCDGQYFSPLAETRSPWKVQPRSANPLSVSMFSQGAQHEAAAMVEAAAADVTVLLTDDVTTVLRALVDVVGQQEKGGTRVAIGLGQAELSRELLHHVRQRIPCVSFGDAGLNNDHIVQALMHGFEALAARQAAPCILSAIRRAWIERAKHANEPGAILDGLLWSTWSWVGRPLFAQTFGEVEAAAYPHLMGLRSAEANEWYVPRFDIPDKYQAGPLTTNGGSTEEKFHLYLSGAGGTGKSCFLHYVYTQLLDRSDVLPVWYRVDSPGSKWEDIEQRIRQKTVAIARQKMGEASGELIPAGGGKLGNFLVEMAKKLRATKSEVQEIVVFIDQLERTFESGDEPNQDRLKTISREIIALLNTVKGEGIRVFIASRKQYLPDFLQSFEVARVCQLHFNVLQTLDAVTDRTNFVDHVLWWCKKQNLVDDELSFDRGTREQLAESAKGHPLNMMLALIQLFSRHREGRITERLLDAARPWKRIFDLDLQAMAKDDVDWNFLLAMAHARAEIVRFEEVWWRLRLVDPKLTRRVEDDLRLEGVRERLWLLGHFGRTIHPRPYLKDPARFLEFFHANLRDYLLREVMGQGDAELVLFGRKCETPEAWRALDRLSTIAHEWEQIQQPLAYDDVRVLMLHKHVVVEKVAPKDEELKPKDDSEEPQPFHLLFERDAEKSRPRLCQAAKECFVFSALLYDESGRWAFETLFPEISSDDDKTPEKEKQDRITCCKRWLRRCSPEQRKPVLRYVFELLRQEPSIAQDFMTSMVHPQPQPLAEGLWLDLAQILAEPFYASRYRDEVVAAVVEKAVSGPISAPLIVASPKVVAAATLPSPIGEFIAAACGASRDELVSVLSHCAKRFRGSQNERLRRFVDQLESPRVVDDWPSRASPPTDVEPSLDLRERHGRPLLPVELKLGSGLAGAVTLERAAGWHKELRERLGVPLPEFGLTKLTIEEGEANELELRLRDKRIATGSFYDSRVQISAPTVSTPREKRIVRRTTPCRRGSTGWTRSSSRRAAGSCPQRNSTRR